MSTEADADREAFANTMAKGLCDVIDELHGIDPVDLVSYIRYGRYAAIEDLVQSSTELFFKEGTLTFGWTAAVDMAWDDIPTVILGMEFSHLTVSVFFNLSLRALGRCVEISSVLFDPDAFDPAERLFRLSQALADAHLPKRSSMKALLPSLNPPGGRPLLSR